MMNRKIAVLVLFLAVGALPTYAQTGTTASMNSATAQVHDQLRAVKQQLVDSVNKNDEAAVIALLNPKIVFTAMNNDYFTGIDGAKAYYERMRGGATHIVDDIKVDAEATQLADLYQNNSVAVGIGSTKAHFKMVTGNEFDIPLRWTASLVQDGGRWTITSLHFSANVFDNPISKVVSNMTYGVAGVAGLLGLLIGIFLGRAKKKST